MTDLVRHDPPAWVALAPAAKTLAQDIYKTEFVPQALRGNGPAVLACVMAGAELGLGPMTSLQLIDVIQGRPALKPEGQRALVQRAGHRFAVRHLSSDSVTVWGRRADSGDELEVTWTMQDADRAGLAGKGPWRQYPDAMLLARATSALCRALFADVISGIGSYTPEELGHNSGPPAAIDAAPGVVDVVEIGEPHSGDSADPEWDEAVPAEPLAPATVVDDPPYITDPTKQVADPDARIARKDANALEKRLKALPEHLQEKARELWLNNGLPTHPDGRLRLTQLTEGQHHLLVSIIDTWPEEGQIDDAPTQDDTAQAMELIEQGGLA